MEKKLKQLAEQYGCNNVELIAEKDGGKYYSLSRLDDDGTPMPIGLPIIILVKQSNATVLEGKALTSFLDFYNTGKESGVE